MLLHQADMALFGPPGAAAGAAPPLAVSAKPTPSSPPGPLPRAGAPRPADGGDATSRAPALEVSIGRLDVVAPPPAPPPRRRARLRPRTSLASYLDRRREVIP